jgi:hypothetical protein
MVKKKLGGKSPDEMDAAMLTFAEPVTAKTNTGPTRHTAVTNESAYDPYRSLDSGRQPAYAADRGYDPYR